MSNMKARPIHGRESVKLYTIREVSTRLGCSAMHVYRLIAAGELDAVDIASPDAGRSKTRVRDDNLADYIERKTRGRPATARA
jgi:excisionase family DNA binding protein